MPKNVNDVNIEDWMEAIIKIASKRGREIEVREGLNFNRNVKTSRDKFIITVGIGEAETAERILRMYGLQKEDKSIEPNTNKQIDEAIGIVNSNQRKGRITYLSDFVNEGAGTRESIDLLKAKEEKEDIWEYYELLKPYLSKEERKEMLDRISKDPVTDKEISDEELNELLEIFNSKPQKDIKKEPQKPNKHKKFSHNSKLKKLIAIIMATGITVGAAMASVDQKEETTTDPVPTYGEQFDDIGAIKNEMLNIMTAEFKKALNNNKISLELDDLPGTEDDGPGKRIIIENEDGEQLYEFSVRDDIALKFSDGIPSNVETMVNNYMKIEKYEEKGNLKKAQETLTKTKEESDKTDITVEKKQYGGYKLAKISEREIVDDGEER